MQRARRRRGSAGRPSGTPRVICVDTSPMPPLTMSALFRYSPDRVERVGDLRVVERDLVGDPLVVDLGAVSGAARSPRPSRCPASRWRHRTRGRRTTACGRPRPRSSSESVVQLVEGLRDLVALLLELGRRVPDVALDARHERRAVEGVVDGAVLLPVLGPELVDVRLDGLGCRDEPAARREAAEQAGLRDDADVGRRCRPRRAPRSGPRTRFEPWYSTSMPVQVSKSAHDSLRRSASRSRMVPATRDLGAVEGAVLPRRARSRRRPRPPRRCRRYSPSVRVPTAAARHDGGHPTAMPCGSHVYLLVECGAGRSREPVPASTVGQHGDSSQGTRGHGSDTDARRSPRNRARERSHRWRSRARRTSGGIQETVPHSRRPRTTLASEQPDGGRRGWPRSAMSRVSAGVSKATASRALSGRGYVADETRRPGRGGRRRDRLHRLPRRREPRHRAHEERRRGHPVRQPLVLRRGARGHRARAARAPATTSRSTTCRDRGPGRDRVFDFFLARKRVDAVIAVGVDLDEREVAVARPPREAARLPRRQRRRRRARLSIDDRAVGQLATEHLLHLGHTRIAHLAGAAPGTAPRACRGSGGRASSTRWPRRASRRASPRTSSRPR